MRIIIADDEQELLDFIANMPQWAEVGYEIVGKAANGAEALKLIDRLRPDLVVADIRMPVMDGLELAAHIRQDWPGMPVIFLTAHDEFEYAQQAVKLGIMDFITKPFHPQALVDSVKLLRPSARHESAWVWQDEFFAFFYSKSNSDEAKQAWLAQREFVDRSYILLYAEADAAVPTDGFRSSRLGLKRRIEMEIERSQYTYWTALSASGIYFLLFEAIEADGESSSETGREIGLARNIISELQVGGAESVSIGISAKMRSYLQLPVAIGQINRCMEYRMLLGKGSIIAYEALDRMFLEQKERRQIARQEFGALISAGQWEQANHYLRDYYKRMLLDGFNKTDIQSSNIQILEILEAELKQYGIEPTSADFVQRRENLLSCTILTEMMQLLGSYLQEAESLIRAKQEDYTSSLTMDVMRLIRNHYAEDLTLQMIAEKINVNYSYLSRSIKKETDRNFRDLLREIRLEEARKKLIHSDLRAYEVAYAVGFKDPQHFSEAFKQQYGKGPSAYREDIRKGRSGEGV
jgi:two-component system response regulator YesN